MESIYISIVIPLFNEENNIEELYLRLVNILGGLGKTYELILVDDGSSDGTLRNLNKLYEKDSRVHLIQFGRNFGQALALAAGFDYAKGKIIISMDGDFQHDPADISRFLDKIEDGYDVVSGWRKERVDNFFTRRLPSMIANWIIARISGIRIHDFGTTFKAYRKEVIKSIELYGEMHRFIPAIIGWTGASIVEIPIKNNLRTSGSSNYNLLRVFKVVLDLLTVNFFMKHTSRPMHIFGLMGLFFIGIGAVTIFALTVGWLYFGLNMIENRGILLLAALCVIMGIQFITIGLISEVISRIYYKSQNKKSYFIREIKSRRDPL